MFNDTDSLNPEYAEKEHAFKIITQKREFYLYVLVYPEATSIDLFVLCSATDSQKDLDKWFKAFHSAHSSLSICVNLLIISMCIHVEQGHAE